MLDRILARYIESHRWNTDDFFALRMDEEVLKQRRRRIFKQALLRKAISFGYYLSVIAFMVILIVILFKLFS